MKGLSVSPVSVAEMSMNFSIVWGFRDDRLNFIIIYGENILKNTDKYENINSDNLEIDI